MGAYILYMLIPGILVNVDVLGSIPCRFLYGLSIGIVRLEWWCYVPMGTIRPAIHQRCCRPLC